MFVAATAITETAGQFAQTIQPIRLRGYVLAAVMAPLMAFWLTYGEIVLMTASSSYSIVPGVLALFFLIALVNSALNRLRPAWTLNAAEMALIYSVATLSAVLAGFDFLQLLPVSLAFTGYFGPQQSQDTFSRLGASLPWWYRPADAEILRLFFSGRRRLARPRALAGVGRPARLLDDFRHAAALHHAGPESPDSGTMAGKGTSALPHHRTPAHPERADET